jgi:hypothetical protein
MGIPARAAQSLLLVQVIDRVHWYELLQASVAPGQFVSEMQPTQVCVSVRQK